MEVEPSIELRPRRSKNSGEGLVVAVGKISRARTCLIGCDWRSKELARYENQKAGSKNLKSKLKLQTV